MPLHEFTCALVDSNPAVYQEALSDHWPCSSLRQHVGIERIELCQRINKNACPFCWLEFVAEAEEDVLGTIVEISPEGCGIAGAATDGLHVGIHVE